MGQPRCSDDAAPLSPEARRTVAAHVRAEAAATQKDRFGYICATIVMGMMIWLVAWGTIGGFGLASPSASESPPNNVYGSFGYPIASPLSIVFPDTLTLITQTPIPATPEPVSSYQPLTSVPDVICGSWATVGRSCVMPSLPDPTSTPLPSCPTAPDEKCIWTGHAEDASPMAPTPWATEPVR